MAKIGVRQKAQILNQLHESLRKEAPLCSLEATSTDPNDPNVYCIDYNGYTTWPIGKPEDKRQWRWRSNNTRGYNTRIVSEQVLQGLEQQHKKALSSMDEFYQAAVQHLAPRLVMDVLEGRNRSFKEAFDSEVDHAMTALKSAIRDAGDKLAKSGYDYESGHELRSHSTHTSHKSYLYANGKIMLNLPPVMTYLLLPQIAHHVSLFIIGLNAMTAALPKEEGFTVLG